VVLFFLQNGRAIGMTIPETVAAGGLGIVDPMPDVSRALIL
jgi:hypothetical protein